MDLFSSVSAVDKIPSSRSHTHKTFKFMIYPYQSPYMEMTLITCLGEHKIMYPMWRLYFSPHSNPQCHIIVNAYWFHQIFYMVVRAVFWWEGGGVIRQDSVTLQIIVIKIFSGFSLPLVSQVRRPFNQFSYRCVFILPFYSGRGSDSYIFYWVISII